ncbi:hypothetical protein [Simiduia aestuariiviva]|uniref:Helix-turn-helix domain-containing protein n=1 Tax=Simiduia aestuariiviva TaxID=1510459 RepID=A0A839UTW5_9GAMM|nr:hypothetical protein [Simiduia aestuariiviva]MBB3170161.1 hypothetical protein [Simiduia aestuariiviva]
MARTDRKKHKGRGGSPTFVRLFHRLLDNPDYINLGHTARSLLIDVLRQYNGRNNGDLCVTLTVLRKRGWTSNDTMRRALGELINAGWIIQTRQGGRNSASLYAVTFEPIDDCRGKHDLKSTITAPRKL